MGLKTFLAILAVGSCTSSCVQDGPQCATLYQRESYQGSSFSVSDSSSYVNLAEKCPLTETGWESTGSFSVENGCKLTICNDTSFGGNCQSYTGASVQYLPLEFNSVQSANCSCSVGCTGVAATSSECFANLEEMRNDIDSRIAKYDALVKETLRKEGDSRDTICKLVNGEYRAYSKFCDRDGLQSDREMTTTTTTTTTTPAPPRKFRLISKSTSRCMSHNANQPAGLSDLFDCQSTTGQQFTFEQPAGVVDPYFQIKVVSSGNCIGPSGNSIQQSGQQPCTTTTKHLFKKIPSPTNPGYFQLQNQQTGKCLAIQGNQNANTKPIILYDCGDYGHFLWKEDYVV